MGEKCKLYYLQSTFSNVNKIATYISSMFKSENDEFFGFIMFFKDFLEEPNNAALFQSIIFLNPIFFKDTYFFKQLKKKKKKNCTNGY